MSYKNSRRCRRRKTYNLDGILEAFKQRVEGNRRATAERGLDGQRWLWSPARFFLIFLLDAAITHVSALARCFVHGAALSGRRAQAQTDPLPSWNDGAAKQAIIYFVHHHDDQAARILCRRRRRESRRSIKTARCGSSIRCTRSGLLPRRVPAVVEGEAGTEERRSLQDGALGRSRGDRQAHHDGSGEDPRRTLTGMSVDDFEAEVNELAGERQIHDGIVPTPS